MTHPHDPVASIWERSGRAPRPMLHEDRTVDVAIVGAGIVGLTTALLLARAGRSVAVLEARRIGDGTTGRSTAKVTALQGTRYRDITRVHGPEAARTYARAQLEALGWMGDQVRAGSIDCRWEHRSAVTFATSTDGAMIVREEAAAAAAAGLSVVDGSDVGLPFPTTAAVVLDDQAQFSPIPYLEGLASEIEGFASASVHEHTRVTAVRGRGPHEVVTQHATVRAEHVVVATLSPITDRAALFALAEPKASYTVAVAVDGELPQGMYLGVDQPSRSLRTAVHGDREVLLVGGESSKVASGPAVTEAVDRLVTWARQHFAVTDVVQAWSAHDLVPTDHLPWVGPTSPVTPRVLTATGFEKWGMTMGTAAAQMIVRNLVDGTGWGIFHPRRVAPRAWPSVAKLNAGVADRLVRDWLHPDAAPDADGQGRRYRGTGLRPEGDPDGDAATPPVRVVCTHLGGVCRWNDLERTWDCPLHGSRFDADGEVIAGPAVRPLSSPTR